MKAADVLAKTGITYRQLNYWCAKGILPDQDAKGPGTGKTREFTENDIQMIEQVTALAVTIRRLGLFPVRYLTNAERVEAINELLRLNVDRFKAIDFIDKWLPIRPKGQ